jgi:hypothetical protein
MTEPSAERPLPAPPRPGPAAPAPVDGRAEPEHSEHVPVFEAEYDRLQRELGTIDQL